MPGCNNTAGHVVGRLKENNMQDIILSDTYFLSNLTMAVCNIGFTALFLRLYNSSRDLVPNQKLFLLFAVFVGMKGFFHTYRAFGFLAPGTEIQVLLLAVIAVLSIAVLIASIEIVKYHERHPTKTELKIANNELAACVAQTLDRKAS